MPLLAVSPNLPDGADAPSRKRSHEDFLGADSAKSDAAAAPRKPSGGSGLIADIENRDAGLPQGHTPPPHRAASPDDSLALSSPLSDSPLSLLTDADSSSSLTRVSPSPKPTPSRPPTSGALPELVITLDAMPASQIPPRGDDADADADTQKQPHQQQQPPPAKRKRLTAAEREEKAKADAARKREKERQEAARKQEKERLEAARKQERDEKNAAAEAKKKALAEEREKKRRQREEEEQRRAERNEEKEKRRREKEDEERRIQEAKQKKERSQLRLNSFFRTGPATTSAAAGTTTTIATTGGAAAAAATGGGGVAASSPQKYTLAAGGSSRLASASPQKAAASASGAGAAPQLSEYDRIFRPFFVKENVVMTTSLFGLDDDAKKAKAQILDEHLDRADRPVRPLRPFSHAAAVDYFQLPCCPCSREQHKRAHARGRTRPAVRKIMDMLGDSAYGGSGGARQAQAAAALDLLRSVPMKYLAFREDVRPPYYGTVTSVPAQARLAKLARNPLAKTVLPLSYDYDSEAEWVDDGDGEDVDDLDDDEELEPEEDEEMADFLDDSEDNGLAPPRPAFSGGMEPESTGLCWENEQQKGPLPEMESYRMERILNHDGPIDPLSTQYWEPAQPVAEKPAADTGPAAGSTKKPSMRPPPTPTPSDAFAALLSGGGSGGSRSNGTEEGAGDAAAAAVPSSAAKAAGPVASAGGSSSGSASGGGAGAADGSGSGSSSGSSSKKAAVGVAEEHVADLKKAVLQYAKLSKLGLVEMLSVEFLGKCTKSQIKASVEALAERTGPGQHKTWKLKE